MFQYIAISRDSSFLGLLPSNSSSLLVIVSGMTVTSQYSLLMKCHTAYLASQISCYKHYLMEQQCTQQASVSFPGLWLNNCAYVEGRENYDCFGT